MENNNFILFRRLWNMVSSKRKFQFFILLILLILASIAELISIGAIVPFLGVLTNPEIFFKSIYLYQFIEIFKIKSPNELLLPFTFLFSIAIFFSGLLRFLLLWSQTKISYAIGSDFSNDIYKKTLYQPYSVHVLRNSSDIISIISEK